jgi:UTP--glucose-1-phosphate uridylyltransferase
MVELFESAGADAVIAFEPVPPEDVVQYGIAQPAESAEGTFLLRDIVEKPAVDEAPSNLAVAARYVFAPTIFDALAATSPGKGGEIQLTDAIRLLIKQKRRVLGLRLPPGENRFDIGNFDSYFRAFVEFALDDPQYGASLTAFVRQLLDRPS